MNVNKISNNGQIIFINVIICPENNYVNYQWKFKIIMSSLILLFPELGKSKIQNRYSRKL